MARVLALIPDLLFGSQVEGMLRAAGDEVELLTGPERTHERLDDAAGPRAEVLVIDMTDGRFDGADALESLRAAGALSGVRTLAFYSHVDGEARAAAERAGFDLIVPRSRMAREGAALVASLSDGEYGGGSGGPAEDGGGPGGPPDYSGGPGGAVENDQSGV